MTNDVPRERRDRNDLIRGFSTDIDGRPRWQFWLGVGLVVLATTLWAGIGSSVRLVEADTWTVIFWRGSFSGLALLIFAVIRRTQGQFKLLAGLDRTGFAYVLASAAGTGLYIAAIHKTSVADVAVIYATMPFLTALLAWLWYRQSCDRLTLIASLLATAGVVATAQGASGIGPISGQAIAVAMTLMYAAQPVIMRGRKELPVASIVCLASFTAAAVSLPLAHPFLTSGRDIGVLAVSGILYGALGDLLFAYGSQLVPPVQTALLTTLDVPLSASFVWLVAGEAPQPLTVIGGIIILGAFFARTGLAWALSTKEFKGH
jgi:drug/metabolite transporter (DMT)-like permease